MSVPHYSRSRRPARFQAFNIVSTSVFWFLLASFSSSPSKAAQPAARTQPPNILFILTDDQSCSSLGCYGGKLAPTPNLDRLADQGIRFTDAYVMPQCTPTRAALLSGQHTARNGMWHVIPWYGSPYAAVAERAFREEFLPTQSRLPHRLRESGYTTGMAGKWHLTTNPKQGYYTYLKEDAAIDFGFDEVAPPGPGSQNEGDKWVEHLTRYAADFIKRNAGKPWFFYLSHHTLHGKVSAPSGLIEKYRERGAPETGLGNATYLAAIEHLDHSVGNLLGALEETGQKNNTLIVFLSDNGGVDTQYNHLQPNGDPITGAEPLQLRKQEIDSAPLREGKGSMYEGGIRVPCIVHWPEGVNRTGDCDTPIHVVDWLPTLLAAARAPADTDSEDGVSLLPLFSGKSLAPRSLYWYLPLYDLRWASTPCAIIRSGDWKLIEFFGDHFDRDQRYQVGNHTELYNLANDLGESKNLATQERDRVLSMQRELREWIRSCQAEIPNKNPQHDIQRPFFETKQKPAHVQTYQSKEP
ncbi:MAG: sulfatase [Planctomycetota bacterium]